jgi:RNA polymerase sigma-70 factor, ECF subfamily
MNLQSDVDLIQALANGDETALRTLVDRYAPSVYRFSVRYTGDESLAQDVCQEVFLKVYRHAGRYKPGMPFKTWLFTIVRNTSIDLARPFSYRKIHSLDVSNSQALVEIEKQSLLRGDQTPEENYSSKQKVQKVASAVKSLPEKQRTAVILKYYDEMPIKEIAEVMETTSSSVESLLVRAKRNLLNFLEGPLDL